MELYITVAFWIGIVNLIIRGGLMVGDHPRIDKTSIGEDTLILIVHIGFFIWTCYLKFFI